MGKVEQRFLRQNVEHGFTPPPPHHSVRRTWVKSSSTFSTNRRANSSGFFLCHFSHIDFAWSMRPFR
jgi:hypothetical protein